MGFVRQITGQSAAKDAKEAGNIQASAAMEAGTLGQQAYGEAGTLEAGAYEQAANLQAQAAQQSAEIARLSQLEAAGQLTGAQQDALQVARQNFGQTQQQFNALSGQLAPAQALELSGLQRQQQALGGQAELAGGAQQQLAALLGLQGGEVQQQAQSGVLDNPAQQALRDRAAKLTARSAAAIGGLGGGNVRSALFQQNRALDDAALQQRMSMLGGISQLGTQGLGLGATGLGVGALGQQAQLGANQTGQIAGLLQGLGQAQAQGTLGAAGASQAGILGRAQALSGGQLGAAQARSAGLTGGANAMINAITGAGQAQASGLLGAAQAKSQGVGNLLSLGGTIAGAYLGRPPQQQPQ